MGIVSWATRLTKESNPRRDGVELKHGIPYAGSQKASDETRTLQAGGVKLGYWL